MAVGQQQNDVSSETHGRIGARVMQFKQTPALHSMQNNSAVHGLSHSWLFG